MQMGTPYLDKNHSQNQFKLTILQCLLCVYNILSKRKTFIDAECISSKAVNTAQHIHKFLLGQFTKFNILQNRLYRI